jgi:hypothetical protein
MRVTFRLHAEGNRGTWQSRGTFSNPSPAEELMKIDLADEEFVLKKKVTSNQCVGLDAGRILGRFRDRDC